MHDRLHDETIRETPTARPPLRVVLGRAGSGKTAYAVRKCVTENGLLIASSPAQADTLIERITERGDLSDAEARMRILPFRRLVIDLYQARPADGIRNIGRVFRSVVVAHLTARTLRPDDFLGPMRDTPGFARAWSDRLREWKLAGLTPDTLQSALTKMPPPDADSTFPRKMEDLLRLFRAYETFLRQNGLRDEEDCLRLAAQYIAETDALPLPIPCLCVDGFYRFNPAQLELLAAFARRGMDAGQPETEVVVTLPCDVERPLLFASVERTLHTLHTHFDVQTETLPEPAAGRPPTLQHLEKFLWRPAEAAEEPETTAVSRREPLPETQETPLLLFDAPNPYTEAEMIARAFRRAYDAGGLCWSDFGIILRTQGDYAPILAAVFERYGIPLGVDGPEALTENPLIVTILHLFAIFRKDWQREDVLAFLKSSYTAPDKLSADTVRRLALKHRVREGRTAWLKLAEAAFEAGLDAAGETLHALAECEDVWAGGRAEPLHFVRGMQDAIARFALVARVQDGEPVRAERDLAAWEMLGETLEALSQMDALTGQETLTFAQFHDALLTAWQGASSLAVPQGDLVRVYEPFDSRERPLRIAAVMGLTERVFPRRAAEDPFLRDSERAALREISGIELESQRARADDERLFYYLAVTAPSDRLILSYPRSSSDADTLPSFYLDETRAAFGTAAGQDVPPPRLVSRTLADVAPQPEDAVSEADRLLAACAALFEPAEGRTPGATELRQTAAAAHLRSLLHDAMPSHPVRAILASRRLPRLPRLEAPPLRADFAGHKTVYSVSELEAHQRCPFQYLLRHVLRIQPQEEESLMHGTLLHDTLRRYFRRKQRVPDPAPPDTETLRRDLHAALKTALDKQPLDAAPVRQRMAHRLLHDALDGFAAREVQFTTQFQMRPAHFELAFGLSAGHIEDEERETQTADGSASRPAVHDAASLSEPLHLLPADGSAAVALCGVIDRVDFDASGQRALIMDYKLGSPPDYAAIHRGTSLQMPLYLLAIERLFGKIPAAACYDSARHAGRPRLHRMEHVNLKHFGPLTPLENGDTVKPLNREQYATLVRQAEQTAIGIARDIEAANVEARPGPHCTACAYADICRTTPGGGHDGETLP